jgi:mRNA-degrading endonuclease toxin of MazEF toxin-antitoxin module
LDSVESVAIAVLTERIGRLADETMRRLLHALEVAVDCEC